MWEVTKNPPIASYYAAAIGIFAGWSEKTLHLGFLLPAVAVILGTYWLACLFTRSALLAALVVLAAPAFLVSAATVMCDTMMLAFWIFAIILWVKGLQTERPLYLAVSAILIAACALTKYFGVSLIPLLLLYSHARQRRFGYWIWFLLIPVMILAGYHFATSALYGRDLLLDSIVYVRAAQGIGQTSVLGKALVGIDFVGGSILPALLFAPMCWSRRGIVITLMMAAMGAFLVGAGWLSSGAPVPEHLWKQVTAQLLLYIAGGSCVLALAVMDLWNCRDADALLLAVWVCGTFYFCCLLNWTINVRSVLPMLPAVGILLARRLDLAAFPSRRLQTATLGLPLLASGLVSIWLTCADTALANSAREAADMIKDQTRTTSGSLWVQGHWGFQYYMESLGAKPMVAQNDGFSPGGVAAVPENNTNTFAIRPELVQSESTLTLEMHQWVTTMHTQLGAGFYSSLWGPLPFAFGRVPAERYRLVRLVSREQADK